MARIFISHAHADKDLVDDFVDVVLDLGLGVEPDDIFYSSRRDSGVPSGHDLNARIRQAAGDAQLVIAILTPHFLASPYCMAELGAAWARADRLFPIALPGMAAADMVGVLSQMEIHGLDKKSALNELNHRIYERLDTKANPERWERHRDAWLVRLEAHQAALAAVPVGGVVSTASCSRRPNHMEVFWTDRAGTVFHRWWFADKGWSKARAYDDVIAVHVAAVSRAEGDQRLFGVGRDGRIWARYWVHEEGRGHHAGRPEWLPGRVQGPLTAVSHRPWELELVAWTLDGEPCHLWRRDSQWTDWTTKW
jgi:hypothetical protein